MSTPRHSSSPSSEEAAPPSALSRIESLDTELVSLSSATVAASELLEAAPGSTPSESSTGLEGGRHQRDRTNHDLAPVHRLLVQLAVSLQVKVDEAARELALIRQRLSMEISRTAAMLQGLGDVKLPTGFPLSLGGKTGSLSTGAECEAQAPAYVCLQAIHQYRDQAVQALQREAANLGVNDEQSVSEQSQEPLDAEGGAQEDFNAASDRLDTSFQHLRRWLDQLAQAARNLQASDGESNTLRRFPSHTTRDIDSLEREAVINKMAELSVRNCSIQSRKPVRSLGHTLDLQEIMLLAKNAKSLVYEVSLQMLKIVDMVKGEEIVMTSTYHRLTKENSELLRRYCFYLKLKIHQL